MRFIFFIFLNIFICNAWSQDTRWIDLEWESVTEAKEYEIHLFQDENGKSLPRGKYKTDTPEWSHAVPPGKYFLRLRTLDKRGVPGEWSEDIPLKIRMQNPILLRPVPNDKVSDSMVTFEWGPVVGAHHYQLIVRDQNKKIIHNAQTSDFKSSVYLEKLGSVNWTVLALEKDEDTRDSDSISDSGFKNFTRVGGLLEAPKIDVSVNEKVIFAWEKVRSAQAYEVDYFPVPDSGDKNRRFKLKLSPLTFSAQKLKDGISTITIKAIAPGYQDSLKSIVKISKSGSDVAIEDIIQGRQTEEEKAIATKTFFSNELYLGVTLAKFSYKSENSSTDTRLDQESLSGLGLSGEWNKRPNVNSLNRKLELSFLNLSSGIDSGRSLRGAYTYHKEKKIKSGKFTYGGGASFLSLPSFMGNRFTNKVEVESSSTIGPEVQLGLINPLNAFWELQSSLAVAYHPVFISSRSSGEKAFPWLRALLRVQRYYTDKQAFYAQMDYQSWKQEWSQDYSELSGVSLNLGVKSGF